MQLKDLKFIIFLSGFIGLFLGIFALFITVSYGVTTNWRTIVGFILNIVVVLGSIAVFVSAAKMTVWSMKKITVIYVALIFSCFAHDIIYLTIVNAFPGLIFQAVLLLIYRFKKKNPGSAEVLDGKSAKA